MCLVLVAYKVHPRYPLVLVGNRDEFLARPAEPLHRWSDDPTVLAGRDLQAGGTWLGVTTKGRLATVTNHRDLRRPSRKGRSRGALVVEALHRDVAVDASLEGYNLLHGPFDRLRYQNNVDGADGLLTRGFHGLSNAVLDTPWPKVTRTLAGFRDLLQAGDPEEEALFALLADERSAPDTDLPDTGLPLAVEKALSAPFIRMEGYGTRCTTVVLVGADGVVQVAERTHGTGLTVRERVVTGA